MSNWRSIFDDELFDLMAASQQAGEAEGFAPTGSTAWIASGLSAVAAECGRLALERARNLSSVRVPPAQYCATPPDIYDPILLTYRGRNNDICAAARRAASGQRPATLITGRHGTKAAGLLKSTLGGSVILPAHSPDRAFVSMRSSLALSATALGWAAAGGGVLPDRLRKVWATSIDRCDELVDGILSVDGWADSHWFVLGGAVTAPARLAWERGMSEASICSPVIGDLKDFTHGRYMSPLRHRRSIVIILQDSECANLAAIAQRNLSSELPVFVLKSDGPWPEVMFSSIISTFRAIEKLAAALSLDLQTAPLATPWRNWGSIILR